MYFFYICNSQKVAMDHFYTIMVGYLYSASIQISCSEALSGQWVICAATECAQHLDAHGQVDLSFKSHPKD